MLNALSVNLPVSAKPTAWFSAPTKGMTVNGTAGADDLSAPVGSATLVGGAGDDTYVVWNNTVSILEQANGGIDTVQSYAPWFVLPANVENLQLMWTGVTGRGNALDNIIWAGPGNDTLDGGGGNDILVGGAGADTFVEKQGNGSDTIVNFTPGTDKVQLQNYAFYSFASVQAALHQNGADAVLNLGGGESLVFRNTQASALTAVDFELPSDPSHPGMRLTFDDEFNSFSASPTGAGTTWKTSYKINDQQRTLASNNEAEFYSDSSVGVNPFSLKNGVLDITAAPGKNPLNLPYNSGAITTAQSFSQEYGYFEVRAQLPAGQGFWPAFWLLPQNGSWPPEIDIFEVLGNDPTTGYFSLHTTTGPTTTNRVSLLPDLSTGFHTFGLSWGADKIVWYVDGNEVAEAATPADMHQPMYMLLNLGVGGAGSWPGQYAANMPTGQMLIDYVRVWQDASVPVQPKTFSITGPGDVAASGGTYTLQAGGATDLYDFTKAHAGIHLDATNFSTKIAHTVWGSSFGDDVQAGAGVLNFVAGAGADVFRFGTGTSRVIGGTGNDTFVFTKGAIGSGDQILDFHETLATIGEHDLLRFQGFTAAAHLDFKGGSGGLQYYQLVDGSYVSPIITVQVVNGTAHLSAADYSFG